MSYLIWMFSEWISSLAKPSWPSWSSSCLFFSFFRSRFYVQAMILLQNKLLAEWSIFWGNCNRRFHHPFLPQLGLPCSLSSSLHCNPCCPHSFTFSSFFFHGVLIVLHCFCDWFITFITIILCIYLSWVMNHCVVEWGCFHGEEFAILVQGV